MGLSLETKSRPQKQPTRRSRQGAMGAECLPTGYVEDLER